MRISHQHKFVFLANPQSGSTSIRKLLDPYSDIKSSTQLPYHHHVNAPSLRKHFQEMDWEWKDYLKFTTIRNPWSKMVGRYFYGLKNPKSIWHEPAISVKNFKEFIEHPKIIKSTTIEKFAFDASGKCLVDYILKIETIDSTLPTILKKVGIHVKEKIQKTNTTSHKHYSYYYDEETKNKIEERLKFDIEWGNYTFEKRKED